MLPRPSLGSVLGKLSARTTFEMEAGAGASSASGYIGMPVLRRLRAETGLSWFKGMRGATFSLLIAAELPSVRSYTTISAGGGNPALGTQYVQGSAIYNSANGNVAFEAGPAVQRGGVSGRVFLDANQNGRYDKGDTPLAGVRVVVGPVFATSDSSGNYSVWDLLPYEPTPVTVDSASIPSPLWVPAFNAALVEPSPNRFRNVDVPVLPGGAVEGMVRWSETPAADSAGERSVAGVVLVLRHKASGEQRVITTFTDGGFYVMGLRPGEWEVTVDQRCLGLLHASVEVAKFSIRAMNDGDAVNGFNLTLRSE
jgi:hypothetical protein